MLPITGPAGLAGRGLYAQGGNRAVFASIQSLGVRALAGFGVTAEADISGGLPGFTIVGLPDSAVKESADRVRSACKNLKYPWPASRITVNLAPAGQRKAGTAPVSRVVRKLAS